MIQEIRISYWAMGLDLEGKDINIWSVLAGVRGVCSSYCNDPAK